MKKNPKKATRIRHAILKIKTPLRLIIGAANIGYPGWIDTDLDVLDISDERDWTYLLSGKKADLMLSEHVFEHIEEARQPHCLKLCYRHLKSGGRFRLAVPDGFRPDEKYQNEIQPPNDGHTMVFNYITLQAELTRAGFKPLLLEYFDEAGVFHARDWDPDLGMIRRSARFDTQEFFMIKNGHQHLNYTSLIVDALKP